MSGDCMILIGAAPKGMKSKTIVMLTRKPRSKWWHVTCFGQKSHYRADGSCQHTDEVLRSLNPACVPIDRVRVKDGRDSEERG